MAGDSGPPAPGPTFFVLGAAKCGTTSLCDALARHPDVLFSTPKEPVFFEREYERGLDYYREEYFPGWQGERAVGEGRVYHLYLPFVPARIHAHYPDARLIAILRDPVQRAHSHWWHRVSRGYERRSFDAVVGEELAALESGERFRPAHDPDAWRRNFFPGTRGLHADVRQVRYVEMGHYDEQVARYLELFGASNLRVLRLEDLVRRPGPRLRDLWDFLQVDPRDSEPRLPSKNTAEESVKSGPGFLLERLGWRLGLDRIVPKKWRTAVRRLLSRREAERPEPSTVTRDALARHYEPHDRALARLLGWEPAVWSARE